MEDWCLRFPGIKNVEHIYFHAVHDGNTAKLQGYLERAYQLGEEFWPGENAAGTSLTEEKVRVK
jgi:hypothetical protein